MQEPSNPCKSREVRYDATMAHHKPRPNSGAGGNTLRKKTCNGDGRSGTNKAFK